MDRWGPLAVIAGAMWASYKLAVPFGLFAAFMAAAYTSSLPWMLVWGVAVYAGVTAAFTAIAFLAGRALAR